MHFVPVDLWRAQLQKHSVSQILPCPTIDNIFTVIELWAYCKNGIDKNDTNVVCGRLSSTLSSRTVPQSPTWILFQGDLVAQEGQVDLWDQACPLDPLSLVDLETLEDPDLPARDVI